MPTESREDRTLIPLTKVLEMTGFSRRHIYRLKARRVFPKGRRAPGGRKTMYLLRDVKRWIDSGIEAVREEKEWSYESANQMLAAMRSFCLWLHDNGFTRKNVAKGVKKYNEKVDRHHDRRELSDDEITALFAAALSSRRHRDGGPVDRYLLCRTALESGFRKSEFVPLDKSRFELGADPGVYLEAGEDKGKRGAKQPISRALAMLLRDYFIRVPDRKNILRVPYKTDQLMRRLCKRAKVPYKKNSRFADFHSWRHTFISRIANATNPHVSLWTAKELARHKHITTTEKYVHRRPDDERRAIEAFGTACAALALAQDGLIGQKMAHNGTAQSQPNEADVGAVEAVKTVRKREYPRERGLCAGRGSNPQPSASEAKGHSHAKNSKSKTYAKRKPRALQRRLRAGGKR